MPRAGQEIVNPPMGVRIVFRRTAADTDGEWMECDVHVAPGRAIAEPHLHPRQTERMTVMRGWAGGVVGGESDTAETGDVREIPPGVAHAWWNASPDRDLHLRVRFTPALHTGAMFERVFAWAAEGHTDKRGIPSPLRLAVLLDRYPDEFYPARLPVPVLKVLLRVLAPIGRLLGYRAEPPVSGAAGRSGDATPPGRRPDDRGRR